MRIPPETSRAHWRKSAVAPQGRVAAGTLGVIVGNKKINVKRGEPVDLPPGSLIGGGTHGRICWNSEAGSFRSLTWIASSRRFLRSSTRAATPAGLRSSTQPISCGGTGKHRTFGQCLWPSRRLFFWWFRNYGGLLV